MITQFIGAWSVDNPLEGNSMHESDAANVNSLAAVIDARVPELINAIQKYFDLMHDCDTSRFDEVFRDTAKLHGFRDDRAVAWSAQEYREILDHRQSPKSLGSVRADEILLLDFGASDMAFAKVRVRISAMTFVDYLTWHCFDGAWLITSKGFRLMSIDGALPT
jgi:Putative lumazine-binding